MSTGMSISVIGLIFCVVANMWLLLTGRYWYALIIGIAGISIVFSLRGAEAHELDMKHFHVAEEHDHSLYDQDCCNVDDCRPALPGEIVPTDAGWLITRTGEVFGYNEHRVRRSKDSRFHICSIPNTELFGSVKGMTRCIYRPDMAT